MTSSSKRRTRALLTGVLLSLLLTGCTEPDSPGAPPAPVPEVAAEATPSSPVPPPAAPEVPAPAPVPAPVPAPAPAPAAPVGETVQVLDVVDGDTVKVSSPGGTLTLRLIGLDTPETKDPRKPVQCFGREASARAAELLAGQSVRIEYDDSQGRTDRYGRTLAYLWLPDGSLYNERMVAEGYAHEYTYDNAYRHQQRIRAAEETARAEGRGLWSPTTCAGDTTQPADGPAPAAPAPPPAQAGMDPQYSTCKDAQAAGHGPYTRGIDPEYEWYRDGDGDGVTCE